MILTEREILLNTEPGGFSLPLFIVDWLREEKGWHIPEYSKADNPPSKEEKDAPLLYIDNYWSTPLVVTHPAHDEIEVRINSEVIEAVKLFKKEREKELDDLSSDWIDTDEKRALSKLNTISVKKIKIALELESRVGIEQVVVRNDDFYDYSDLMEDEDEY